MKKKQCDSFNLQKVYEIKESRNSINNNNIIKIICGINIIFNNSVSENCKWYF